MPLRRTSSATRLPARLVCDSNHHSPTGIFNFTVDKAVQFFIIINGNYKW